MMVSDRGSGSPREFFALCEKCGTLRVGRRVPAIPPHGFAHGPRYTLLVDVAPVLVYSVIIFYTGLIRIGALPEVGFVATDKLLHALVFGGLAFLCLRAVRSLLPRLSLVKHLSFALFASSFLGALLEICQWFTTYRSADVLDWVADTIGAVLMLALSALAFSWRSSTRAARGV